MTKKEKEVTVSKYLVSLIEKSGVDFVPGITGGAIMKIIDELGQSKKIKYISPNHEQALAMMVDGYARLRGFGVGVATSGPGGTNLLTGIACAYYDSTPCLFITGQVGMFHVKGKRRVRQRGFQETDIVSLAKPITKYSVLLDSPQDTRYVFEKAVYLAKTGRPGPVLIDVPYNVQRAQVVPKKLRGFKKPKEAKPKNLASIVKRVIADLKQAARPVILVGGGVRLANKVDEVRTIVEKLGVPVISTWAAVDNFTYDYPLYLGNAGRCGNPSAIQAIQESDFLLGLGTRFTTKIIIHEQQFARNAKIVSVDIDKGELDDSLIQIDRRIHQDLRFFIPELQRKLRRVEKLDIDNWRSEVKKLKREGFKIDATRDKSSKFVSPYLFVDILSDELPSNAVTIADAGCNLTWTFQAYKAKKGQRLFSAWGHSPMGYSFAASIGAYYAERKEPIIAIIGDGGFQMNIQELQTVATNKVPIKVFVLNNKCYGNTKFPAKEQFEGRAFGNEPGQGYEPPDFMKIGKAYGIKTVYLENERNLRQKIQSILKVKGPLLIEVNVDPEQFIFDTPTI